MDASIKQYVISRALIVLVIIGNALALFFLMLVTHRLVGHSAGDLSATTSIIVGIAGTFAFMKHAKFIVRGSNSEIRPNVFTRRKIALALNVLFVIGVFVLWQTLSYASGRSFRLGESAYEKGHYAAAINKYERALYQNPNHSGVNIALANLYEHISQYEKAKEHYWLSVYSENSPFTAYNNLARLYIREGEVRPSAYDDALGLLELALQDNIDGTLDHSQSLAERQGVIYKNMAWANLRLGLYNTAQTNINDAYEMFLSSGKITDYPELACLQAIVLARLHNIQKGRRAAKNCRTATNGLALASMERALAREAYELFSE